MKTSNNLLLIFTRNPELGKVKSRLAADVGNEIALEVYQFLLNHTKKITENLNLDKQVWYSQNINPNDIWDNNTYNKQEQIQCEDLGNRMRYAFDKGFSMGYKKIIIIGSDLYDISPQDIISAFTKLENKQAVIGPATDGGFYLLGLTTPIPEIFKNKKWGTSTVLPDTLTNLEKYTFELLEERNDVDYVSDIESVDVFQPFLRKAIKK